MKNSILLAMAALFCFACGGNKKAASGETVAKAPEFVADSAFAYCQRQCDFGPRTMNSAAHDDCGRWIAETFRDFGMVVIEQRTDLKGYDGTTLKATNIIAQYKPELQNRILFCAHWDSRPWADNDPDEANHHTEVMAANDGASGVGVMLELARVINQNDSINIGIDFICFDAEDWGVPQWAEYSGSSDETWALGATYWAQNPHREGYKAQYGVLLDMVGGKGAKFYQEGVSLYFASHVVDKVWKAAGQAGYGSLFPRKEGGAITDDHLPINRVAGIPCIDVIPYYADCEASSFGPTWHTVNDTMENLDRSTLKAVGQTMLQVIWNEAF